MGNPRARGFTLIELMIVVAIIGVLAMLATFSASRYIRNAKTAEATANIGALERFSSEALVNERSSGHFVGQGQKKNLGYGFCGSEPNPVPKSVPKGAKYVTGAADWSAGKGAGAGGVDVGYYCLRFSIAMPQYYSYTYTATGTGSSIGDKIDILANGDLDGNNVTSEFKMEGQIASQGAFHDLVWAPKPLATKPEE